LLAVEGGGLYGSVLLWHEQKGAHGILHASLFAGASKESRPIIVPLPTLRPLPRYQD
jgi:hypothetical protein